MTSFMWGRRGRNDRFQPQRGCGSKPRVGASPTLGRFGMDFNPNGVVSGFRGGKADATPLGLDVLLRQPKVGEAPTLGCMTESLWDSGNRGPKFRASLTRCRNISPAPGLKPRLPSKVATRRGPLKRNLGLRDGILSGFKMATRTPIDYLCSLCCLLLTVLRIEQKETEQTEKGST
jgi:hypothetical protein